MSLLYTMSIIVNLQLLPAIATEPNIKIFIYIPAKRAHNLYVPEYSRSAIRTKFCVIPYY